MPILRLFKHLYVQVLLAIVLGVLFGHYQWEFAIKLKPLADGFILLIKMLIPPVIFLAIVSGIMSVNKISKVGKIGGYAFVYFMVMTTLALVIGLLVSYFLKPGSGFTFNASLLDITSINTPLELGREQQSISGFILNIIPKTFFSAFSDGHILQVLLLALLFAFALSTLKQDKEVLLVPINALNNVFFKMMDFVLKLAPIGAFAAIAFSVGHFGLEVLWQLIFLVGCFYVTCIVFIFGVLGTLLKVSCKISILQLLWYLRNELLIVFATSSSETVLTRIIKKLEALGAHPDVVRLVVPTGYSFNLDGTVIYLTMAALFIAQAMQVELDSQQIFLLLGLMIITSKGAAAVSGGGFITLAATLTAFQIIPVEGIVLVLGVDRFMAEGRALTNVIGNSVATLFVAQRLGELNQHRMRSLLAA